MKIFAKFILTHRNASFMPAASIDIQRCYIMKKYGFLQIKRKANTRGFIPTNKLYKYLNS